MYLIQINIQYLTNYQIDYKKYNIIRYNNYMVKNVTNIFIFIYIHRYNITTLCNLIKT